MNISHLTPTFADIKTWVRAATVTVNQLITGKQDKSDNLTSLSGLDLTGHSGDAVVVTAGEDGFDLVAGAAGGTTTNPLTMSNGGAGAASGTTFDGSVARTISYNTVGAAPASHSHAQADVTGLTTADSPQFTAVNIGHATDTTLSRVSAGVLAVEGVNILTTATGQPLDTDLSSLAGLTLSQGDILYRDGSQLQRLAAGTSGQVLRTAGAAANPTWGRQAHRGALVRKAADQTGANYTASTAVAWDQEAYDTDSIHDNVTNNTRLTVPSGVSYVRVSANILLANVTADGWCAIFVRKNGATFDGRGLDYTEIGSTTVGLNCSTAIVAVTPGDWFDVTLQTETDTSIDITATSSWFAMEIIE